MPEEIWKRKLIERIEALFAEGGSIKEPSDLARDFLKGAEAGAEVQSGNWEEWLEKRAKFQLVFLDLSEYITALIRALWLAPQFVPLDFRTLSQRDFSQTWADTTRGFLGEIAFQKFVGERLGKKVSLSKKRGELEEFLPSDIEAIFDVAQREWRAPKINLSIKTGKFNARWMDFPGVQADHSELFVLTKVGLSRTHFISFLKAISFLKDKLFASGETLGELNSEEAGKLWAEIPDFVPVPVYVAGFLEKEGLNSPVHFLQVQQRGRGNNIRWSIERAVGFISRETVGDHLKQRNGYFQEHPIAVEPMIKNLREGERHFLATSGDLMWGIQQWDRMIQTL